MNLHKIILFSLSLLLYQSCSSQQTPNDKLLVSIPTIEQEATSIWRTINDIAFLEEQGYTIHLPQDELINSLITTSKNEKFGNDSYTEIYNLLEENIYNESNYELALKKVTAQENLINKLIDQLYRVKETWNWEFSTFDEYDVIFTLYGTGGSYDPELGTVTLFTTIEGDFMNYDKPSNTIIHEIVHMGIEESIVQKYSLPHGLKERIVDKIVYIMFGEFLPEYKIQNMGDTKIDAMLRNKEDLEKLDSIVKQIIDDKDDK